MEFASMQKMRVGVIKEDKKKEQLQSKLLGDIVFKSKLLCARMGLAGCSVKGWDRNLNNRE